MKKLILILLLPAQIFAQSTEEVALFNSLFGTTGNILTPNAYTVGKFSGNIGVFENFGTDSLDNLVFNFGVHEKVEIGIQSDIPTQPEPRLNFFFKFQANKQGEYFGLENKWIPATAFGINRNSAFAVTSYDFKVCQLSLGYNFSDNRQSVFSNVNIPIKNIVAVQLEYVDKTVAGGLRARYKGLTLALMYVQPLENIIFDSNFAFWEISYNFEGKR